MHSSQNIEVPLLWSVNRHSDLKEVSAALDTLPKNAIANAPWADFSYKPDCAFTIAHHQDCIFLKFFIIESDVLARFTQPNDLVYKDSCVEFFIAFNGEKEYYNLEFNSIGTCYLGYGLEKEGRETADVALIQMIKSETVLYRESGQADWELTLIIPNVVFYHHQGINLASIKGKANFYKCGDELPVPHYLSWNNIESAQPNFHLSDFFGEISFSEVPSHQMISSSI